MEINNNAFGYLWIVEKIKYIIIQQKYKNSNNKEAIVTLLNYVFFKGKQRFWKMDCII